MFVVRSAGLTLPGYYFALQTLLCGWVAPVHTITCTCPTDCGLFRFPYRVFMVRSVLVVVLVGFAPYPTFYSYIYITKQFEFPVFVLLPFLYYIPPPLTCDMQTYCTHLHPTVGSCLSV